MTRMSKNKNMTVSGYSSDEYDVQDCKVSFGRAESFEHQNQDENQEYDQDFQEQDFQEQDFQEQDFQEPVDEQTEQMVEEYNILKFEQKLQNPCKISVRESVVLPSEDEMYSEWILSCLNEKKKKYESMGVVIRTGWEIRRKNEIARRELEIALKWQHTQVLKFNSLTQPRKSILSLSAIKPWQNTWDQMCKRSLINSAVIDRYANKLAEWKWKKKQEVVSKKLAEKVIERNSREWKRHQGPNKNKKVVSKTVTTKQQVVISEKLLRKNKEKNDWIAENLACQKEHALKPTVVIVDYFKTETSVSDTVILETQETSETSSESVDEILDEEISCETVMSIIDKKEEREKKEKDEMEEEEHFLSAMSKKIQKPKIEKTNKKKVKTILKFQPKTLIDISRENKCKEDVKYAERTEAFSVLSNPVKQRETLKFTSLCRSVLMKKKCYHKDCRFAHSISQLVRKDCRFGLECRLVEQLDNNQYKNKPSRTGKTCSCLHPGEHDNGFTIRMGFPPVISLNTKTNHPASSPLPSPSVPSPSVPSPSIPSPDSVISVPSVSLSVSGTSVPSITWSSIVLKSMTDDEKKQLYGKGAQIAFKQGHVEGSGLGKKADGVVELINMSESRLPGNTSGLGFKLKTVNVSSLNFNWVKGCVLQPEYTPHRDSQGRPSDLLQTVEGECQTHKKRKQWDEKHAYILAIEKINLNYTLNIAKNKALEISNSLPKVTNDPNTIIFRVSPPLDGKRPINAEKAIMSALRSGLTNFKIEFST